MTSSGTTGRAVFEYIWISYASNQQKTLVKIVSEFTGVSRMPMLIIDSPSVLKSKLCFLRAVLASLFPYLVQIKFMLLKTIWWTCKPSNVSRKNTKAKNTDVWLHIYGLAAFYKELIKLKEQGKTIFPTNSYSGGGKASI